MKFYLSSYKLGDETKKLKQLAPSDKIGYIPSALDFSSADPERRSRHIEKDIKLLSDLGFEVELLNLQDYFNKHTKLKKRVKELGAVFISGGNVFVLRQAMKLSGLDKILKELRESNFLYAGYSAAGCVLSSSLRAYEIIDQIDLPYNEDKNLIWDGLGFIDFMFIPHWDSDHPESEDVEKEILYCEENNISYRALRDGEVIIIE